MHAVMHDPGGPKSVYTEQFSLVEYSCIDCSYMQLHPYYTHITQWMQTMLFFMSLFHFFFFWPVQIGHLISSTFYQIGSKIAVCHTFFNIHHTFLSEKNRQSYLPISAEFKVFWHSPYWGVLSSTGASALVL